MARPPALTTESGYVNPASVDPIASELGATMGVWWWDLHEQVPDLVYPWSLKIFSRMYREDSRVRSMLSAISLPIRRTAWRIDPNGAEDEVVELVANDLGLPIVATDPQQTPKPRRPGGFSWDAHLAEALSCLRYGHAVMEQVYEFRDGRFHLSKLAPRPQFTIRSWGVARDGGLDWIEQYVPAGADSAGTAQRIDISRLVVYRNDPEPGVWIGQSLLRSGYKNWLLKDELMRIEAAAARRNGIGVPVATANENDSRDPKKMKNYESIATRFRGGMSAGAALPNGAKLEILGVQGNLPDLRQAIEYHDKQIALAGLAHFLNLDKGGSYALASVQADTFVQSVQAIAEGVTDITNRHVVADLVDANFSIDAGCPLVVADEIGSRQDATAAALNLLIQAGLLDADPALKAFIRQNLGAPPIDPSYTPPPAAPPAPTDDPDEAPTAENRHWIHRTPQARKQSKSDLGTMTLTTGKQGVLFDV